LKQVDFKRKFLYDFSMKKVLLSLICFVINACSSAPPIDLQQISLGDEKGTVLHKLGSPERTYFKENTQRWVYKIKQAASPVIEKEIWFQEGKVVFVDIAPRTKKESIPYVPVN
jgi:hypothetical protein